MEQIINGRLIGDGYRLELYTEGSVSGENEVALSIVLEGVKENDMQLMFEYPAMLNRRNVYYSEFMRLNEVAPNGVVRYEIPRSLLCCAGKVYVQAVLGVTGSLKWSAMGEDASFVTRVGSNDGTPESGMLTSIRSAYERTNAALEELEHKTAEDFGGVSNKGGAIEGNLDVSGTLRVNGEKTATERELAALRTELGRESLDVDPRVESTAGSVVTVDGTPTGKYLEPDDYKIALPLRQRENMLPYVGDINRTQNKLHVESRGNGSYLMKISGSDNVDNNLIRVAISPQVIQKGTYYIHLRNNAATIGASFNIVGIGEPAFLAENRIFTVTVAADTTVNEIIFYTLPTTAPMEFLFRPSLERVGDVTEYVGFTGALSPTNPIPVESPSAVTVKSVGQNLISIPNKEIVINNWYYTDEHPNPHFLMTVGKTYTFAFEYEIENATAYVVCDTGRGTETSYKQNMINGVTVASVFPAKGRTVIKFTVQKSNNGDYFWFRPLRFVTPNTITNAHVSNVMLVEGAYTAETMPEFTPYESETAEIAPRDVNGNAVALSGGVAGAENTIEYKDGKPYYIARTGKFIYTGFANEPWGEMSAQNGVTTKLFYSGHYNRQMKPLTTEAEKNATLFDMLPADAQTYAISEKQSGVISTNATLFVRINTDVAADVKSWKNYLAAHPLEVRAALATPVQTELDPASLPILQTYSPETTFYISSDVEGLNPSIDLTALSAQNATFAKGMLKLNNGEVLTPLTTADMVLTADGSTVENALANIAVRQGTAVTVGGAVQTTWNADTKLNADATAARATADANGSAIATTYATKTELAAGLAGKQDALTMGVGIQNTGNTLSLKSATQTQLGGIKIYMSGTTLNIET